MLSFLNNTSWKSLDDSHMTSSNKNIFSIVQSKNFLTLPLSVLLASLSFRPFYPSCIVGEVLFALLLSTPSPWPLSLPTLVRLLAFGTRNKIELANQTPGAHQVTQKKWLLVVLIYLVETPKFQM